MHSILAGGVLGRVRVGRVVQGVGATGTEGVGVGHWVEEELGVGVAAVGEGGLGVFGTE